MILREIDRALYSLGIAITDGNQAHARVLITNIKTKLDELLTAL